MLRYHTLISGSGISCLSRCRPLRLADGSAAGLASLRCQYSAQRSLQTGACCGDICRIPTCGSVAALRFRCRAFASGEERGGAESQDNSVVTAEDAAPAKGKEGAGLEAKSEKTELATGDEMVDGLFKEKVEDILVRAHRKEVIERHGTQAERYLPNADPNSFLLSDNRLEPNERSWQKVFVTTPWIVFAIMLVIPLWLVRSNLPFLQKRAEEDREAAGARNATLASVARVPDFEIVSFGQMPDVLERPFPTILLLFDRRTLESRVFLPALRDIEAAIRSAGLRVSVTALDLGADPGPPDSFLWEYPRATAPHIQLIVPRVQDGEAGVVDYDGRWSSAGIIHAARSLAGPHPAAIDPEVSSRIDVKIEKLFDSFFDLLFVESAISGGDSKKKPGFWDRLAGSKKPSAEDLIASEERASARLDDTVQQVDVTQGLDVALASCQAALVSFRGDGKAAAA